jgi:hypothetical protein
MSLTAKNTTATCNSRKSDTAHRQFSTNICSNMLLIIKKPFPTVDMKESDTIND